MLFIAAMGQKDGGYFSFFRKDFLIKRFCDLPFLIAESVYADSSLFKFHTRQVSEIKNMCNRSLAIYNSGNRTYFSGNHGCPPSAQPVYVSVWKINNPVPSALLKAAVCETDPLRSEEDLSVLLHRYLKDAQSYSTVLPAALRCKNFLRPALPPDECPLCV